MKTLNVIYLMFIIATCASAQVPKFPVTFWKLQSLSGSLYVSGEYREQRTDILRLSEISKTTLLKAGISLRTQSYVWHPSFLVLNIDGDYNPGSNKVANVVNPDRAEILNLNKLDLKATFFKDKPINLIVFANFHDNNVNREYLTSLRSTGSQWGAALNYRNGILPITVQFKDGIWNQKEVETGRMFNNRHKNLQVESRKSFTSHDNNILTYSHDEYFRQDPEVKPIINIADYVSLINRINFGDKKKHSFNSNINNINQTGDIAFKRLQTSESISLNLPNKFRVIGRYQFYRNEQGGFYIRQHSLIGNVQHQLFSSLKSKLFAEYYDIKRTDALENRTRLGGELLYTKKIAENKLTLSYRYSINNQNVESNPVPIRIFNERHILNDDQIILLKSPYIDIGSVIVRDTTNTIIYQIDLDYFLIQRGNFIEIQRRPGGQIANGGKVFVDYVAIQPGSYKYNAVYNSLLARIEFFKKKVWLYAQYNQQKYKNVEFTDFLTLNAFKQTIVGTRFNFDFITGGIEYDLYNSEVIPYELWRYYINMSGTIGQKMLYSANANWRHYSKIDTEINQNYLDINGRVAYNFTHTTRLSLDAGYRYQDGRQIDLNLLTMRVELNTSIRKLLFRAGFELYSRDYVSDKVRYSRVFLEIRRVF